MKRSNAAIARCCGVLAAHLSEPVRLVDVGARGGVDRRWEMFATFLEVLGFEPDPAECERLNGAAGKLRYRARFLPYVLGAQTGEVTFNVCRWPVASSVYEPNPEVLEHFPPAAEMMFVAERRRLASTPLDDVCARESLTPDFLKVDVEGSELDVLRGGRQALQGALVLDVEVEFQELFRGQPLFADVDTHMRGEGWRLLGLRRISWRRTAGLSRKHSGYGGQLISADALYFNAGRLARGLTTSEMLKLLVIFSAYRQHDFVLALLHEPPVLRLQASERRALRDGLVPPAFPGRRLLAAALGTRGSHRRRSLAD